MKLGIVISTVLVAMLSLLGFFAYWGVADSPTVATTPSVLMKRTLPTDAAPLFISTIPHGDASRVYQRAIDLYVDNRHKLNDETPPPDLVNTLVSQLIEAMHQEQVSVGFLDEHLPVQVGATPDFIDALETIPALALMRAEELHHEGNAALALSATRAVWAFGQRAFEYNRLLYIRMQGLVIMLDAGEKLLDWTAAANEPDRQNISQWMKAVDEIAKVWRTKHEQTVRLRPHIGDLLNMASNDQDISFRVAAILQLGLVKFNPGNRGNHRVILATIEQAKSDPDPLIVQAGIAAAGMTPEQMRKIH